jgi:hypothetical protein
LASRVSKGIDTYNAYGQLSQRGMGVHSSML